MPLPSLGDEIEAMVEELAKQRKPLIERSSAIGRGVGDRAIAISESTAWAAGFVRMFWSATRLLMIRGWLSITVPADCSYDVAASALRNTGFVRRGKTWSADPSMGATMLLWVPSTARKPTGRDGSAIGALGFCLHDLRKDEVEIGSNQLHGVPQRGVMRRYGTLSQGSAVI